MPARLSWFLLLTLLVASPLNAKDKDKDKDKKKSSLPEIVLRARTVLVVIHPDAGEPLHQPTANATARENVERALMNWGRLQPVLDEQEADLVIAVRTATGRMMSPTVKGGPIDTRPTVMQPTDTGIRIGAQQGHAPPLAKRSRHVGAERRRAAHQQRSGSVRGLLRGLSRNKSVSS